MTNKNKDEYPLNNSEIKLFMENLYSKIHTTAPETRDMINKLSGSLSKIQSHFEKDGVICMIKDDVKETKGHTKETNGKLAAQEKKIAIMRTQISEEPEKKFASKLTEKLMYGAVALILVAVIGQWLNLIFIKGHYEIDTQKISEIIDSKIEKYDESFID